MLGLIGGPLALIGGAVALFGALDNPSAGLFVMTAVEIAWELSIATHLTFKGFRRDAPILARDPRHA